MFKAGQANPYDDIVNKTTDENLTGENWELILNLCDKVQDEGEQGARNVLAAVIKRLAHRNPNVQLYALSLSESLSKNCGINLHREIASRAFTQALEKLITDRTTHDKVRRRALQLIAMWTAEFENDPTLGVMEDCYNNLKSKNYKFDTPQEPPPPDVDDEIRRKEEEELQRVLEMSVQDKGGRNQTQWAQYSSYSSAGASGSSSSAGNRGASSSSTPAAGPSSAASSLSRRESYAQPSYPSGYVPARGSPAPRTHTPTTLVSTSSASSTPAPAPRTSPLSPPTQQIVTRVRALHTFEPSEPGELAFDKGDIIKVVDRGYKDWWRGQLKGRTGIFPVNYVEPLPEPTPNELAREAEQEAAVFYQAMNVDRLLTLLRHLDPAKDNLADNEEIQELYRTCMTLRPKIVKLIDKYSQKRADLISMNEGFIKARTIFERMMEDSLARHTQAYDYRQPPPSQYQQPPGGPPGQEYGPQTFGWNPSVFSQPGYNAYPAPATAYTPGQEGTYPGQPQPYPDPQAYAAQQSAQSQYPQPYGVPSRGPSYAPQAADPRASMYIATPQQQPGPQAQSQPQPQAATTPVYQPQQTPQPQSQPQTQQPQPQLQRQQSAPQQQTGPPYIYDPNTTYADANVQAWAQYYAQGGKDPTGSVYFISVPGVREPPAQTGGPVYAGEAQTAQSNGLANQGEAGYQQTYSSAAHQSSTDLPGYADQQVQREQLPQPNGSQPGTGAPQPYSGVGRESLTELNGVGHDQGSHGLSRNTSVASTMTARPVYPQPQPSTTGSSPSGAAEPSGISFKHQESYGVVPGSPIGQPVFQNGAPQSASGPSAPWDHGQESQTSYPISNEPHGAGSSTGYAQGSRSPGAGLNEQGQQSGWPGYAVASQFAGMQISGEGGQAPHALAAPQGVHDG